MCLRYIIGGSCVFSQKLTVITHEDPRTKFEMNNMTKLLKLYPIKLYVGGSGLKAPNAKFIH